MRLWSVLPSLVEASLDLLPCVTGYQDAVHEGDAGCLRGNMLHSAPAPGLHELLTRIINSRSESALDSSNVNSDVRDA